MQVLFGTDVPTSGGNNGDYYFRYHNGTEAIYKKVDGSWVETGGSGTTQIVVGYGEEESFEVVTSDVDEFIYSVGFSAGDELDVWINGVRKFEGADRDWEKDAAQNKVTLSSGVSGTANNPTYVMIRRWIDNAVYDGEQEFEVDTTGIDEFVYTAGFETEDRLDVWVNGARKFEGALRDWTRDAINDKVIFNTAIDGSVSNPQYVNIRKW